MVPLVDAIAEATLLVDVPAAGVFVAVVVAGLDPTDEFDVTGYFAGDTDVLVGWVVVLVSAGLVVALASSGLVAGVVV